MIIELLVLSLFPSALLREEVGEGVFVQNFYVQSWFVYEPINKVKRLLNDLDCVVLPDVQNKLWQCLTEQVIYSWDYRDYPSLWSETERTEQALKPGWFVGVGHQVVVEEVNIPLYALYQKKRKELYNMHYKIVQDEVFSQGFALSWVAQHEQGSISASLQSDGQVAVTSIRYKK